MQIKKHDISHMVELRDGSSWRIWPSDIPKTLEWFSRTEIDVADIDDEICSHVLTDRSTGSQVRVISVSQLTNSSVKFDRAARAAPVDAITTAVTAPTSTAATELPPPPVASSKKSQKTLRSRNRRNRGWYDAYAWRQHAGYGHGRDHRRDYARPDW